MHSGGRDSNMATIYCFFGKVDIEAKWVKSSFFVRYIDHVQMLRIGFVSIRKEDILLVNLLNNVIFYQ